MISVSNLKTVQGNFPNIHVYLSPAMTCRVDGFGWFDVRTREEKFRKH